MTFEKTVDKCKESKYNIGVRLLTVNLRSLFDDVDGRINLDYNFDPVESSDGVVDNISAVGYVQNFSGRLELYLTIDGMFHTNCSRCMAEVDYPLHIELQDRIFRESGDDEYIHLDGDSFDLTDYAEQEINLNLPVRVLCSDSCKGLCPNCGANLNEGDCSCETEFIDSRLAKLKELLDKKEE